MEARTSRRVGPDLRLVKESVCLDISMVQRELAVQRRPAEKIDQAEIKLTCEGGVCEITWHPARKAA